MKLRVADLFCGAGGTSTGVARAAEAAGIGIDLIAINHWEVAVATHAANHPAARHLQTSLDSVDPRRIVDNGKLDILVASPECTHHSAARGGKPMSDQSRASAWHVLSWAQAVEPEMIIVENVPEFQSWGPLTREGRPIESRRGETFRAWIASIQSLGYRVDWRVLNAADFGDPTTRRRLFILARRGRRAPTWPISSHRDPKNAKNLFDTDLPSWRSARESVIDWNLAGSSIHNRKRPLAEATLRRIAEGIRRFGSENTIEPFLTLFRGTSTVQSVDMPVPTLTAGGQHVGIAEPFLLHTNHGGSDASRVVSVTRPLPTVTAARRGLALVQPFLVRYQGNSSAESVDRPVSTLTTHDRLGLVEPRDYDVNFRMLQPHELAAAMGFPKHYKFAGNKGDQVRQIGNAVPVGVATALCGTAIDALTLQQASSYMH